VLVLALTGCGGDDEPAAKTFASSEALAGAVGCAQGFRPDNPDEALVKDTGQCFREAYELHLRTFRDNEQRDQWHKVASNFAGQSTYLLGDRWAVYADNAGIVEKVRADVGGTIR
jgi:hypothetical protein